MNQNRRVSPSVESYTTEVLVETQDDVAQSKGGLRLSFNQGFNNQ